MYFFLSLFEIPQLSFSWLANGIEGKEVIWMALPSGRQQSQGGS